jgi:hypothetical protein
VRNLLFPQSSVHDDSILLTHEAVLNGKMLLKIRNSEMPQSARSFNIVHHVNSISDLYRSQLYFQLNTTWKRVKITKCATINIPLSFCYFIAFSPYYLISLCLSTSTFLHLTFTCSPHSLIDKLYSSLWQTKLHVTGVQLQICWVRFSSLYM